MMEDMMIVPAGHVGGLLNQIPGIVGFLYKEDLVFDLRYQIPYLVKFSKLSAFVSGTLEHCSPMRGRAVIPHSHFPYAPSVYLPQFIGGVVDASASRGPTTIATPKSQFRTGPSDHGKEPSNIAP
ncbi:hypothetical protein F511_27248 [Dorcoceras hygrometricum]|uniref:Uncharacterized protein n=1 Tax=Dorcoceras hygrometricum TaxID=472368 RepID=A0A2Z7DHP3_9LAMI|nr:hypothetical protein F511_27248 [Dorcoceras hygrometricum]